MTDSEYIANSGNTCGVVYAATGAQYVTEAAASARRLNSIAPSLPICLITDAAVSDSPFDCVRVVTEATQRKGRDAGLLFKTKHVYVCSPFERSLFFDTDTYLCKDPRPVFDLLMHVDIAASHGPYDNCFPCAKGIRLRAFLPLNTGVIGFRKCEACKQLFQRWHDIYATKIDSNTLRPAENDQTSFAEALLDSRARWCTLPVNFNARTPFLFAVRGNVWVLHDRSRDLDAVERSINKSEGIRVWVPSLRRTVEFHFLTAVRATLGRALRRFTRRRES